MLRIIIILIFPLFLFAQSSNWNSVVDLNLSVNSGDRVDLYTDKDGNHILVENGSTLKYYLYSPSGTQTRTSTIDASISATFSKITGWNDSLYISYKEGSTIYSKYSTNAGSSWANLNSITLGTTDSDGMELWTDSKGLHIVYSEYESGNYETKYKLSKHGETDWINSKTVTDESGVYGGTPSVTSSANRVHVGFAEWGGDVKTRDKYSTSWQSSQDVSTIDHVTPVIIASSAKLHAFYCEDDFPYVKLMYKNRSVTGSIWSSATELSYDTDWFDQGKADVTITDNDKVHLVYQYSTLDSYYREWVTSISGLFDFTPDATADGGYAQRISSQENDVYTLWISDDGASGYELKLRQRDYVPLKPTGFTSSWSSNHPRMDWDESGATDFDEYEIEKSDNGTTFSACTTLTSRSQNSFVDQSEIKYTPLGTKTYVYYRLYQVDLQANESSKTSSLRFAVGAPETSVGFVSMVQKHIQLADYSLDANYPNPFNPETKITFGLPEQSNVTIKVYDISGKEVADLVDGTEGSGHFTVVFNGNDLPSGVYVYAMQATGLESGKTFKDVKRMLLVK